MSALEANEITLKILIKLNFKGTSFFVLMHHGKQTCFHVNYRKRQEALVKKGCLSAWGTNLIKFWNFHKSTFVSWGVFILFKKKKERKKSYVRKFNSRNKSIGMGKKMIEKVKEKFQLMKMKTKLKSSSHWMSRKKSCFVEMILSQLKM